MHNDGTVQNLLKLTGTITIFYRSSSYNIPVDMWLMLDYPLAPPRVYVTPTQDMAIKPRHPHVHADGLAHVPYLSNWDARVRAGGAWCAASVPRPHALGCRCLR